MCVCGVLGDDITYETAEKYMYISVIEQSKNHNKRPGFGVSFSRDYGNMSFLVFTS